MRSLERAIDVLEVLDESRQALRLSDIARRADLPVATTQRILNVLEARGRVERDSRGYRPGVGLIFGAHAYLNSSPLVLAAQPALHDLAAETGLTASLFKRVGWHRVALARVEGAHPLRYEIPIGERLPLHLGAGKVLCAAMPAEEQQALLAEVAELTRVDGTIRTRSDFEAELIEIRRRGYSYAKGERVPGMVSVAAPVQPAEGPATAAIQVAGTDQEIPDERIDTLGNEVQRAAYAIARRN
jgi:IclR family acetate operon transcriptional repressor